MRPHTSTSRHSAPATPNLPYTLPLGSRSILRNGPLPRHLLSSSSGRSNTRRFFPQPKRVLFRDDLTEIVPAPPSVPDDDLDTSDSSTGSKEHGADGYRGLYGHLVGRKRRRGSGLPDAGPRLARTALGEAAVEEQEEETEDLAGRRRSSKRSKDWVWTVGTWDDTELCMSPPDDGIDPPTTTVDPSGDIEQHIKSDEQRVWNRTSMSLPPEALRSSAHDLRNA